MSDAPPPLNDEPEIDFSKPFTLRIGRVDRQGGVEHVGNFHIDLRGKRFTLALNAPILGLYEAGVHEMDHLPPFVEDVRPQGFIGRLFADFLGLPSNPRNWSDAQVVRAFLSAMEFLPGNLFFVDPDSRVARPPVYPYGNLFKIGEESSIFPKIIREMNLSPIGSSAGGEQPKFPAARLTVLWESAHVSEVLVKYSPTFHSGVSARRWQDLLRVEHHTLSIAHRHGIPSAASRLIACDDRVFLEVERFDRLPSIWGKELIRRIGMVSFWCMAATLWGEADLDRLEVGERLHREGRLPLEDLETLRTRVALDALLANTDTHLWNYSLLEDEAGVWRLSPSYDLLPMALSPHGAELIDRPPPPRRAGFLAELRERLGEDHWSRAEAIAREIWNQAQDDAKITRGFIAAWRPWLPFA